MDASELLNTWNLAPSIWGGVLLLAGTYLALTGRLRARVPGSRPVPRAQVADVLLGVFTLWAALATPLDHAGDEYLFTAHMVQHVLLTLVAAPLLLAGTPDWLMRALLGPVLRRPALLRAARMLTSPVVAFILFNAVFSVWHVPALYEGALEDERVHVFEHLLFIATGLLNWWPVLSPLPELPRLPSPVQLLYLFLEGVPATVLGAVIVFAPRVLYATYAAAPHLAGLDAATDQQVAGLVMWMPGGMIYLLALTLVFYGWVKREDAGSHARAEGI